MNIIDASALSKSLRQLISPEELNRLRDDPTRLSIGPFNRQILLRMVEGHDPVRHVIHVSSVKGLHRALQRYLDRYMPERPEGHKWIILSCLYLTFVAREPMHPQAMVHWVVVDDVYRCPARELSKESVCPWCVCRGVTDDAV